jgi:hypothetical protein
MSKSVLMRRGVYGITLFIMFIMQPTFGADGPIGTNRNPNEGSSAGSQTVQGGGSGSSTSQAASTSGSLENMSADAGQEVHSTFGKTWIRVPKTIYNVIVTKDDEVKSGQGPYSYVRHLDNSSSCMRVNSVEVNMINPDNSRSDYECLPNACSFGFSQCSIPTTTIVEDKDFLSQCRTPERAKNGWRGKVPLNSLSLRMRYANGVSDVLTQLYTDYDLTCEAVPCTPLNLMQFDKGTYAWLPKGFIGRPYNEQIYMGGRKATVIRLTTAGKPGFPPGLQLDATGRIFGVPSEYSRGEWKIDFEVKDGCPWNSETRKGTATLKISDTIPPVLKEVTLTPLTLPYNGGEVVLQVKASDNIAVFHVTAIQIKPDGSQGGAKIPLASGTPTDGVWRWKWGISGYNNTANTQQHIIKVKVEDSDGNVVEATPINVTVEAKSTAPKIPIAPSTPVLPRPVR